MVKEKNILHTAQNVDRLKYTRNDLLGKIFSNNCVGKTANLFCRGLEPDIYWKWHFLEAPFKG